MPDEWTTMLLLLLLLMFALDVILVIRMATTISIHMPMVIQGVNQNEKQQKKSSSLSHTKPNVDKNETKEIKPRRTKNECTEICSYSIENDEWNKPKKNLKNLWLVKRIKF